MRGVAKIEALHRVLAAETRGVGADHDSHGLEGFVIAKVAALPGEDGGDIFFDGYSGGEKELAGAGLNLKREIGGHGWLAGWLDSKSPGNEDFRAHAGIANAQQRACGLK